MAKPQISWRNVIMIDLKATIDTVLTKSTSSRPHEFGITTLESAAEVTKANVTCRVTRLGDMEHKVEIVTNNFTLPVDMGPVYACAGMISGVAFARTQYSNVVDNKYFHML